jgi:hypothetical protein
MAAVKRPAVASIALQHLLGVQLGGDVAGDRRRAHDVPLAIAQGDTESGMVTRGKVLPFALGLIALDPRPASTFRVRAGFACASGGTVTRTGLPSTSSAR